MDRAASAGAGPGGQARLARDGRGVGRRDSMPASLPYPRVLRWFYSIIKGSLCIYILKSASWKHWRIPKLPFFVFFFTAH